jgi:hypothetical protein
MQGLWNLGEEWDKDIPSAYVSSIPQWSKDLAMFGNVGSHYNLNGSCKNPNIQFLGLGLSHPNIDSNSTFVFEFISPTC